jgi:hypothetical protein
VPEAIPAPQIAVGVAVIELGEIEVGRTARSSLTIRMSAPTTLRSLM